MQENEKIDSMTLIRSALWSNLSYNIGSARLFIYLEHQSSLVYSDVPNIDCLALLSGSVDVQWHPG